MLQDPSASPYGGDDDDDGHAGSGSGSAADPDPGPDPDLYIDMHTSSMLDFKHTFINNKHSRLVFLNDIYFKVCACLLIVILWINSM